MKISTRKRRKITRRSTIPAEIIGFISIHEHNSNLYLDTLESMNYGYNKTIVSTSWIEKLPNNRPPSENPTCLAAS